MACSSCADEVAQLERYSYRFPDSDKVISMAPPCTLASRQARTADNQVKFVPAIEDQGLGHIQYDCSSPEGELDISVRPMEGVGPLPDAIRRELWKGEANFFDRYAVQYVQIEGHEFDPYRVKPEAITEVRNYPLANDGWIVEFQANEYRRKFLAVGARTINGYLVMAKLPYSLDYHGRVNELLSPFLSSVTVDAASSK
jgi:hypothetical protein